MHAKLFVCERMAHVFIHGPQRFQIAVELGAEPGAAHLSAALGRIHRHIGLPQQFRRSAITRKPAGQTDAGTDDDPPVFDNDRLFEFFEKSPAHALQNGAGKRAFHDQRELVAAEPIATRLVPEYLFQYIGDPADQNVTDEMPVMVVDELEPVEVDKGKCDFLPRRGIAPDIEMKRPSVGQLAERIGETKLFEAGDIVHPEAAQECDGDRIGEPAHDDHRRRIGNCDAFAEEEG